MHSLPSFSTARTPRLAALLLAAALWLGAPQRGTAADALSTVTDTVTSSTGIIGKIKSLFTKSTSSTTTYSGTSNTLSDRLNRSILGLPIGILKSAASTVSKAASSSVSKHIKAD